MENHPKPPLSQISLEKLGEKSSDFLSNALKGKQKFSDKKTQNFQPKSGSLLATQFCLAPIFAPFIATDCRVGTKL